VDFERLLADIGWRPRQRVSKFVAYFHLLDACAKPGCPVCRCLREMTVRALDALLYEQVTDPGTRGILDRSWGFCAWHAGMSTEVKNAGLGIAIIYDDLLAQLRDRLARAQREAGSELAARGWRRLFRRTAPLELVEARAVRRRCALCANLAQSEQSYLRTALDHIGDVEFDAAYGRSAGVCIPHLTLALAYFPGHASTGAFLDQTRTRLDRLARELRGFIEKHDYRQQASFTDDEAASWWEAATFLAGRAELFGHDIARPLPRPQVSPEPGPPAQGGSPESVEKLRERVEALVVEREQLERRIGELTKRLGDESSRATGLDYRLRLTTEDRKALEMNVAGERATARTWELVAQELRAENERLKARLAGAETSPGAA
jgi:hypothetical protein